MLFTRAIRVLYLVGIQIGLGVILYTVMAFKLLQEDSIRVQRSVRHDCNILQPHRIVCGLQERHSTRVLVKEAQTHFQMIHSIEKLCIDIDPCTSVGRLRVHNICDIELVKMWST